MNTGQFIGTFPLKTDSLPKFRSFISSILKAEKYTINESTVSGDNLVIVAAKGNKLLHYIVEQILEYLPFSELFGWAVRVQVSFTTVRKTEDGYMLRVICEPSCNEMNPIDRYLEKDEPRDFIQATGEDEKCRKAFQHLTRQLTKSKYFAKYNEQGLQKNP
ncbi:MAG: hypothetical protein ACMZ64_10555 [Oleiphilus sp.]